MENNREMLERIVALEQEVRSLRTEVHHLKKHVKFEQVAPIQKEVTPTFVPPKQPIQQETPVFIEPEVRKETEPPEEKRSLEEIFTRALPRIFMVILVLGVLWGLKLVSDYGFLSDRLKIIAGFALSIGLAVFAFMMEKKQKGSQVVALSLYGGSFIVGILTTAAGAILYDVLSLTIALLFALMYIVYGVFISYVKGNEALTVLVVFTSLLLPYLLEYMEFSASVIGIFIVLLFAVVQVVILKHTQKKALYIGMAFSILALAIVSTFHSERVVFFAIAIVTLYTIFLGSYLRINFSESKIHASIGFSFTIVVLTLLNAILWQKEGMLLLLLIVLLAILSAALYIVFMKKDRLLIDLFATLGSLTVLNIIAQLNISWELNVLLLVIFAFAGFALAIKHGIVFMKWVQGLAFSLLAFFVVVFYDVQPLLSIKHLALVLVIAMLVVLYYLLRQYKRTPIEKKNRIFTLEDVYPCLLYIVTLIYIWKLDWAYMPLHFTTYLMYSAIAIGFVAVIVVNRTIIGRYLPILAAVVYGYAGLVLLSNVWVEERAFAIALLVRLLYIAILWAVVVDLWKKGKIYQNYEAVCARFTEQIIIGSMIISIVWFFTMTHFMNFHALINWSTAVIFNTVSIFIIACLSLFLASKRSYRDLKLVGIGLLFFGIVKMIFFDLSELDILIRSISFMVIGAIGLVISNKLLGKGKNNEQ